MNFALKLRNKQYENSMSGMFTELKRIDSEKKRQTDSAKSSTVPKPPINAVSPSRTGYPVPPRRVMRQRQPFDVYQDQYETLKIIAEGERAQGLPGSMSRMVRKGIDMYLKAREQEEL
jgi:hypothetical protein